MDIFKIKQNDTLPYLKYQLINAEDDTPYVLAGDETINFYLRDEDGVQKALVGVVTIFDAPTGILKFVFDSADSDTVGFFEGEFEIVKLGEKLTVPGDRSLFVRVYDDINE